MSVKEDKMKDKKGRLAMAGGFHNSGFISMTESEVNFLYMGGNVQRVYLKLVECFDTNNGKLFKHILAKATRDNINDCFMLAVLGGKLGVAELLAKMLGMSKEEMKKTITELNKRGKGKGEFESTQLDAIQLDGKKLVRGHAGRALTDQERRNKRILEQAGREA